MAPVRWDECVCHGYSDNPGKEVKFTEASWIKLCEAAIRRKDNVYEHLKQYVDGTLPLPVESNSVVRHVNCYKVYTLEKSVCLAERKRAACPEEDCHESDIGCSPQKRLTRSTVDSTDLGTCIICQKCYIQDPKNRRKQLEAKPFTLLSTVQKLKDAASTRRDKRIINQLAGGARGGTDAIAGDILKHDVCYHKYTSQHTMAALTTKDATETNSIREAFQDITKLIQKSVVEEQAIWDMTTVHNLYSAALARHGVSIQSKARRLKDKLSKHFGEKLCFYRPTKKNEPEQLFSCDMDIGTVINKCQSIERELEEECIDDDLTWLSAPTDETPMYSAYLLSAEIRQELENITNMPWPPTPEYCTNEFAEGCIPAVLYNLVAWIVHGSKSYTDKLVEMDDAKHVKVLAICQDILFCCRGGRVLTPKHVSLAMSIRRLTGSTELVTMLNKFGHCTSTSKVQEIETAVGELRQREGSAQIPSNIVKHVPVMFVFDNNDFQEETQSGKGTTHCTNGIIIQSKVYTCVPPPAKQANPNTGSHHRSLAYAPQQLADYPVAPRCGPERVPDAGALITTMQSGSVDEARDQDLAWLLSRLCPDLQLPDGIYEQVAPGWSRMNQLLCSFDEPQLSHNIGYMPVINQSSGDLATVYTAITKASTVVDLLDYETSAADCAEQGRTSVAITVDQAIYAKAVEVCNNPRIKDDMRHVVLRMGAFHMSMTFIAVIGRRYASAGLRDVLVEADVLAEGSVDQVLIGRHYNRAIKTLKLMYEAMWRLRWASFIRWLAEEQAAEAPDLGGLCELVSDVRRNRSPEHVRLLLSSQDFEQIKESFTRYLSQCGPNATFWSDFIDMVQLLLCFVRSTRTKNWSLHIKCLQEMLPWMAAYDRTNYSRYLPLYILDMLRLPSTHPDIHDQLMSGDFAVQLRHNNTFNSIPHDQTIEVTINRAMCSYDNYITNDEI